MRSDDETQVNRWIVHSYAKWQEVQEQETDIQIGRQRERGITGS